MTTQEVVSRRLSCSQVQLGLICQCMAGATAASILPLILVCSPQPAKGRHCLSLAVRAGWHLQAAPRTAKASSLSHLFSYWRFGTVCWEEAPLEGKVSYVSRWPSQALIAFVTRLGRFNFADPQGFLHPPHRNTSFASFLQLLLVIIGMLCKGFLRTENQRLHLDAQILGHFWKKLWY